jgi:hypothetical protein
LQSVYTIMRQIGLCLDSGNVLILPFLMLIYVVNMHFDGRPRAPEATQATPGGN